MEAIDTDRFRYTEADAERINPSKLRVGDVLLERGPVGSGVFAGRRVTFCGWAGYSKDWGREVYRFQLEGMHPDQYYTQPDDMRVYILKREGR